MNEMLIAGGAKKYNSEALLEIDFSRQMEGDTSIIDWSGKNPLTLAAGSAVVKDLPGIGRAMEFAGGTLFQTDRPIDLSIDPMQIDVVFQTYSPTYTQVVWCSGDYAQRIVGGLSHYALVGVGGHQLFATTSDGSYTRCSLGNSLQVFDLSITTDPENKKFIVKNNIVNTIQNFDVPSWIGKGERFSVGGSYVGGAQYAGLRGCIQKLIVSKRLDN